jgi:hypothetical protein
MLIDLLFRMLILVFLSIILIIYIVLFHNNIDVNVINECSLNSVNYEFIINPTSSVTVNNSNIPWYKKWI